LVVVTACGVLTNKWRAFAVLLIEDFVFVTIDIKRHIAADNWGMFYHDVMLVG